MIDSLLQHQKKAEESTILTRLALTNGSSKVKPYAVLTLHRASTVDDQNRLAQVVDAMAEISKDLPIIFPVHPRTRSRVAAYGLGNQFRNVSLHGDAVHGEANGIIATQPLGYLDFLHLMSGARVVLTGFRRNPGRDDDPRCSLCYPSGFHRASRDGDAGYKRARRSDKRKDNRTNPRAAAWQAVKGSPAAPLGWESLSKNR